MKKEVPDIQDHLVMLLLLNSPFCDDADKTRELFSRGLNLRYEIGDIFLVPAVQQGFDFFLGGMFVYGHRFGTIFDICRLVWK